MTAALRETTMVVLGLVLATVPLALWVAWSQFVFVLVLALSVTAMTLLMLLARTGDTPDGTSSAKGRDRRSAAADPRFIEELQRIMPPTHHHGRHGSQRFHRMMARLRTMMEPPEN